MEIIERLEHIAESETSFPLYRYWQIWYEHLKNEMQFTEYIKPKLDRYTIKNHKRKPYESFNF
jgi:hypothetical protein